MKKQTVLVTGAASGIGRACARKLLDEGHDVVALDLKEEALAAALPEDFGRLLRFAGDVSRHECCTGAVAAAIARFGKLDAVTHWAAMHSDTFWADLGAEEFNRVLATNVTGSFLVAQAAAVHMKTRGAGAIVLASSTSRATSRSAGWQPRRSRSGCSPSIQRRSSSARRGPRSTRTATLPSSPR